MSVERLRLHDQGPEFSRIVYGAWRLADGATLPGAAEVRALIEGCLELGITSFDHADIYGGYRCEELFGAALKETPSLRERIEIISKCDICLVDGARPKHRVKHYDTSAAHIRDSVDRSLRLLHCDYLDLLLLHRPDPLFDADESAAELERLIRAGKIRHVGVSNFLPHQVELLASRLQAPIVTNQVEFSVLRHGVMLDGTLDQCQRLRMRPMAWSPLAGGRLFDASEPKAQALLSLLGRLGEGYGLSAEGMALAWILRHPSTPLPVVGTSRIARIRSAAEASKVKLERQDWFEIYEAASGREVP